MFISKVVKGEEAAVGLLKRMKALPDGKLNWCESFAHVGNGSDVDVFVEGSDGLLHDFKIDEMLEMFDGFDTVTPPGYKFVMTD